MSSWFSEGLLLGRSYFYANENLLDCVTLRFLCGKLMSVALENSLVSLTWVVFGLVPGLFPFGFVPVALRLSPDLDLSRKTSSGICSQVPVQQPWTSGTQGSSSPDCWGRSSDTPGL